MEGDNDKEWKLTTLVLIAVQEQLNCIPLPTIILLLLLLL